MNEEKALMSVLAITHVFLVKFDSLCFKAAYSVIFDLLILELMFLFFKNTIK